MKELKDRVRSKDLKEELIGKRVSLVGWVEDIRDLGKIIFMTLRDVTGKAQVILLKDNFKTLKVSKQSIVYVRGQVKESKAKELKVEVLAEELKILSEAKHPLPLDPSGRIPAKIDTRLNARALDLRNPKNLAIFKIRSQALRAIRDYFLKEDFFEVNTPKIISAGAEGGATLFKVEYFDRVAYLAQSPQLYKEQLTASLERVFEISDFFRAEKSHTRRHLSQFTSVDIEVAYCDEEDVMNFLENVVINCIKFVKENCEEELKILGRNLEVPSKPFKRITYHQALEDLKEMGRNLNFGEDLKDEDLRYLGKKHKGFYFIVDWPLYLKPFYIEAKEDNLSRSFDLQYGYLEIASGGMRVSNRETLEKRLKELGIDITGFKAHLDAFSWGMPPHAGWGMGFDRLLMVITGCKNIREVVLYPRDRFRLTP
ncbi:Aspartate--tRNA(Asp/Asn) ligase [archaeon HR06]|nr:Aspartate--tRNA(Asp/Asn) ligase [archaeon HR06]